VFRLFGDRILSRVTRVSLIRRLWEACPVGSVATRVRYDIWRRPHYAYGVYSAACLAQRLSLPSLSVIEFGVAGGRGLLELENIAQSVSAEVGVAISVYGFDSGEGMPEPVDYRDLPNIWSKGYYRMDEERLRKRLKTARLLLGDVGRTIDGFIHDLNVAPVGFAAFDMDYYSSTKTAFRLFDAGAASRLPRVYCYFDEIIWPELACHNPYVGELCAIREFNVEQTHKKLYPHHKLRNMRIHPAGWNDQIYIMHDFQHPLYCVNINSIADTAMGLGK
jgi:hypothetical protein